jgi:hypothetical protein
VTQYELTHTLGLFLFIGRVFVCEGLDGEELIRSLNLSQVVFYDFFFFNSIYSSLQEKDDLPKCFFFFFGMST